MVMQSSGVGVGGGAGGATRVHYGLCNNAKYSTAVHIIQCFSMQNLGLLKFLFLVNPVSVTLWQTAMDQITIIFAHNVSCLHPLTYLSPPAPPTSKGVQLATISD